MHNKISLCRVCGFDYVDFYPWGENGESPTYEICICCGVQFGYEDHSQGSIEKYRQNWIDNEMPWFDKKLKPKNWNAKAQLLNAI